MAKPLKKPPMSKETLLPLLAGHVLAHGLGEASLRPLAKAAGTSDRMLLYHFGTKEALIADLHRDSRHHDIVTLDQSTELRERLYPHWDMDNPETVFKLRLSEQEQTMIYNENARAVYGFA